MRNYTPETDMRPGRLCLEHELLLKMASSAVCVGQWERTFRKDTEKNSSPACTHLLWSSLAHRCPRPAQNIKESSRNLSWNPEYGNRGAIFLRNDSNFQFDDSKSQVLGMLGLASVLGSKKRGGTLLFVYIFILAFMHFLSRKMHFSPEHRCFPWNKRHKTWGSLDPYSSSSKSALQKDSN